MTQELRFGQYAIYKGLKGTNGAFQFNLLPASVDENGRIDMGCIFVQAAPAIDKNVYDWNNQKISFAMKVSDIQSILESSAQGEEVKLIHKHKGETKYFSIIPGSRSGYFMKLSKTDDRTKETTDTSIPLSVGEAIVLKELLTKSIPYILGWYGVSFEKKD